MGWKSGRLNTTQSTPVIYSGIILINHYDKDPIFLNNQEDSMESKARFFVFFRGSPLPGKNVSAAFGRIGTILIGNLLTTLVMMRFFECLPSRSLTVSLPLKSYRTPIGKACLPFPPFFRGKLLNFRGILMNVFDCRFCFWWTTVYIAIGLGILLRFRSSILNGPASCLYNI